MSPNLEHIRTEEEEIRAGESKPAPAGLNLGK